MVAAERRENRERLGDPKHRLLSWALLHVQMAVWMKEEPHMTVIGDGVMTAVLQTCRL